MFNYFLNALIISWLIKCAYTNSDTVCSKNEVSWKKGIEDCLIIGQPMSFHGLTGLKIENINLRPDVTVWTSDFVYSRQLYRGGCLCSFRYLSNETLYETSEELLSYCDDYKYFLCRNMTNNVIDVLNNTWINMNKSRCGSFHVDNQLISILKPGYYWKSNTTECGFDEYSTILTGNDMQIQPILCGAYSKDAGRHFRRCDTSHRLVCVDEGTTLQSVLFDSSCFLETTELPKVETHQPKWTEPSNNVTTSTFTTHTTLSVSHTKSSDISIPEYVTQAGFSTKFFQTLQTSETQMINNSSLEHARGSAPEHGDTDTGIVAGTIAGIVVGVCLALAVAFVLFIFIQRRYRCLFDTTTTSTSMPKTSNGTNNQPKKSKAHTLFNNIGYDSWDDNQNQNRTKRNNTESPNIGTSSTNHHRTVENKDPYYNQSNATYVNDVTKQQPTEASSYSFAVEKKESDVRENEMSLNEYDTTLSPRKGVYKTENVYNKFEPVNKSSNDVYDSTLSQGQSFEIDDVYNKLNCKTKYGKFGTSLSENEDYDSVGNTLKSQNTQLCTDNVYNKL